MNFMKMKIYCFIVCFILLILGVLGTNFLFQQHQVTETERLKEESKIEFQTVDNPTAEIVGFWQGVYQQEPYLHMIFTEKDYKIIQEQGDSVPNYPVQETGTWAIDGNTITLTAQTIIDGVAAQVPRTYTLILESSQEQANNFTILKIGDNPSYFYGMKVDSENQLVATHW